MQSLEPVSILLRIIVSFLLEELLHFYFGHFLRFLRFLPSPDLRLTHWGFGSSSHWIEVYCTSILLRELFRLPPRRLSPPLDIAST